MVSSLLGKHKHACMSKYKNLKTAFRACSVPCIGLLCSQNRHPPPRCLSAGLRYLKLTRLPRHDRGPVPGGNRSAAVRGQLERSLEIYWSLHVLHSSSRTPAASFSWSWSSCKRELKESFYVLRADVNAQGLDVMFSHENLVDVLTV